MESKTHTPPAGAGHGSHDVESFRSEYWMQDTQTATHDKTRRRNGTGDMDHLFGELMCPLCARFLA